jgi:acyl dehydratase
MTEQYLEDFAVGQMFGSGRLRIDKELIKTFAAEFDPQPFHLDEESMTVLPSERSQMYVSAQSSG